MSDFLAALCLAAVLEGLMLFAVPERTKRMLAQLLTIDDRKLRKTGAVVMGLGLLLLWLIRR